MPNLLRHSLIGKRISSFDCAQDGEPVEPYLAGKDVALFFRPALALHRRRSELHASLDTSDEERNGVSGLQ